MSLSRKLILGAGILTAIAAVGTVGYVLIEGWSWFDSLYMTITTIATVGYGEIHPMSTAGRLFSMFLIVGGVGGALYALTGFVQYVLEGDIRTIWGRRRMNNKIERLKDHFILCGFGRVGEAIAITFQEEGVPFVVIENSRERIGQLSLTGYLYIDGDATRDEILKEAGIDHARGLVAAVGTDAENTYITLTGRQLRPDLFIEARASGEKAEKKLKSAGANRIVSPNDIGGRRMAMLAIRPTVVDFIDNIAGRSGPDLQMENVAISSESPLAGQTVAFFRECSKANVLAISRKNSELMANPPSDEKILVGDSLIVIGTAEQLGSVEGVCQGVIKNV